MPSEYDPLRKQPPPSADSTDLDRVRDGFEAAGRAYLRSPWSWLAWALLLPAAALATKPVAGAGPLTVLLLWSLTILAGGLVEGLLIWRRRPEPTTPLASWVFRVQGNLSLVAVALSAALAVAGLYRLLPGVWLLTLGHSFYVIGGLSFPALRSAGLIYQAGGLAALLASGHSLPIFAAATLVANLWMALAVRRASSSADVVLK